MAEPSDILAPDVSSYWYNYEFSDFEVWPFGTPRATAIDRFASEVGCAFADVSCTVAYIRQWTRQDAWDYRGMEEYVDMRMMEDGFEDRAHIDRDSLRWVWNEHSLLADELSAEEFVAAHYELDEPPSDWDPSDDEGMPAWEFVTKDHSEAVKVLICEERARGDRIRG